MGTSFEVASKKKHQEIYINSKYVYCYMHKLMCIYLYSEKVDLRRTS